MNIKEQAFLKVLLEMSGHPHELLQFLSEPVAEQMRKAPYPSPLDTSSFLSSFHWSLPIHYSWFSDVIKEFPNPVKALFLSVLTHEQAAGVAKMLGCDQPASSPSPLLRPFLLNILQNSVLQPDVLDAQLLPPSPLSSLLKIQRKQLIYIADMLGLHDLAADLRQVVDKELLNKIYRVLSDEQRHFLQYCTKQSVKWLSPKLGLAAWDGSKEQLRSLLHYRGLIRLAKAIYFEEMSYKWHLLHHLDIGRAKIIQKEFYQKQDPGLIPYFKNQVLHILKRYQE